MQTGASLIVVRPCEARDVAGADRVITAAFGQSSAPALETRLALESTRAFVAVDRDESVIGFTTLSLYGSIAYVGSMAVDPSMQHEGVGKALMTALVAFSRERDVPAMALDATDAGAPLYAQFGFTATDRTVIMERVAPYQVVIGDLADRGDIALAIAHDREMLACDRSHVLAMLAAETGASVTLDEDGYAICWRHAIGPVVANSPHAARAIVGRALRETAAITRMLVPESTPVALEIASSHGFKIVRATAHMARGTSPFTRDSIYARASHSYG